MRSVFEINRRARKLVASGHWFFQQENGGALATLLPMVKHSGAVIQYNHIDQ